MCEKEKTVSQHWCSSFYTSSRSPNVSCEPIDAPQPHIGGKGPYAHITGHGLALLWLHSFESGERTSEAVPGRNERQTTQINQRPTQIFQPSVWFRKKRCMKTPCSSSSYWKGAFLVLACVHRRSSIFATNAPCWPMRVIVDFRFLTVGFNIDPTRQGESSILTFESHGWTSHVAKHCKQAQAPALFRMYSILRLRIFCHELWIRRSGSHFEGEEKPSTQ